MRCLQKLQAAPLLERNVAIRELDLEVGGHIAGAEDHCHLAQWDSLFMQLQHAIHDETCLLVLVAHGHEPGILAARALGPEILGEPFRGA